MSEITKDIEMRMARHLSEQQDAAIKKAISNHVGREDWHFKDVRHRLVLNSFPDRDLKVITMDGEPILSLGPVECDYDIRGRSSFLRATRGYKILNEKNDIDAVPDET